VYGTVLVVLLLNPLKQKPYSELGTPGIPGCSDLPEGRERLDGAGPAPEIAIYRHRIPPVQEIEGLDHPLQADPLAEPEGPA
jgi:hypothetical protein